MSEWWWVYLAVAAVTAVLIYRHILHDPDDDNDLVNAAIPSAGIAVAWPLFVPLVLVGLLVRMTRPRGDER